MQLEAERAVANGAEGAVFNGPDRSEAGPVRVGVVFAGRQSPGGHNIIWGLHEFFKGTESKVRFSDSNNIMYLRVSIAAAVVGVGDFAVWVEHKCLSACYCIENDPCFCPASMSFEIRNKR